MGACMSAQRVVDKETTSFACSRIEVQQQLQLPTTKTTRTPTSSAIAAAIGTPVALEPQAATQSAEPLGTTAHVDDSGAAQGAYDAAAATGIVDWRPAPMATVTLQTPFPNKTQIQETQYVAADHQPHDSASSTPRASEADSTDYPARSSAVEADITATMAASPHHHDDMHPALTATAAIIVIPANKTKGVTSLHAAAAEWGSRLREERAAKSAAERELAVLAIMAAHLDRQLRGEQDRCSAAEDSLRDKSSALAAAEQLAADLARQQSPQQDMRSAAEDGLRQKDAALAAAEQQAANLASQLVIEQQEHAAEKSTLCAKLAAAEQQEGQLKATQVQLAEQAYQLSASHAQLAQQEAWMIAAQAHVAQQEGQLRAAHAQLAQQEARLSLLPKTMARAAELARQLAAAESAAADASTKLKAERRKGVRLAWMLKETEHFAQALEALYDNLPHLSEGGFAWVDHKTVTCADGSAAEVAVKVVLPPEQPAAAAEASSAAADARSAASSEADAAASSAGDPAPAAACSIAPATCGSNKDEEDGSDTDEDEDQDSDIGEAEEDGSESSGDEEDDSESDEDEEEDAEEVDVSEQAMQASVKARALRLEGAVLNKLCGQPCILGAQAWQGEGRTGLVLPLAKCGSLKEFLWPVPGDRSAFVPQDREQVLRIAGGLCTALLAAHSQGVAHLDVKADNVLLDTNLNVQLADWGTAAPLSFTAAQWRERGIMGSPGLIFPGVLYNPASGGVRHDVYAAGALCYGVLTGRDYARECWEQHLALPKATQKAILAEAGERCEALGYSGDPDEMELLMVARLCGYVARCRLSSTRGCWEV